MTDKEEYEDEEPIESDPAYGYHWGRCRGCGKMGNCSNDDGWCMDCN